MEGPVPGPEELGFEYPTLSGAVVQEKKRLQEWIKGERVRETALDRERDERFE